MKTNELIKIIEEKLKKNISIQKFEIKDKTFLHQKHKSHQKGKYHFQLNIKSIELKKLNRINANKKIFKILDKEIREYIHSIQISID